MKVALYARVSRDDLNCENQIIILKNWVKNNGINDYDIFKEEMTTRKTRPTKETIMKDFRDGKYETVVVTKLDRFARSLQELIMDIENIINNGGRFIAISNGFDFSKKSYNASQQLMLNIFGSFAQFEREMIRERTLEGLARATAQGKIKGRHPRDCGCGKRFPDGRIHNGNVIPIRNIHNQIIGWKNKEIQRRK